MSNVKELNINSTTYDIIGKGVVDQNNTSSAIKTWSGTRAQYNAITTKDSNTLYNITDDATTQLSAHNLFDFKWVDHELNDQSWLRADTFSWQDGTVYSDAYNHLVADYNGGTTQSETIGSYTISYKLASDGHKITTDETNVQNIYNSTGVAWYYVLDTANQRFKLPRENPAREVLGQSAPVNISPNGALKFNPKDDTSHVTAFFNNATSAGTTVIMNGSGWGGQKEIQYTRGLSGDADLSQTAGIYKGKQYLYFYVGQFSQSATEQTAGLNSELFNGKVDLNAANLSTTGKSLISGLGMPGSNKYIDLTLGATGTDYTAPANGWVYFNKISTASNQYATITVSKNDIVKIGTNTNSTGSGQSVRVFLPLKKGDVFKVGYNLAGATNYFKFVYAEGEQ